MQVKSGKKADKKFNGIASGHSNLSSEKVELLHKAGYKVFTYTVNDPIAMKNMLNMRVDGIITDSPDKLKDVLGRSKR